MDEILINCRCRLLGDLDFNPRRECPIRDHFVNGESVSKELEIHRIFIGVCLEISLAYETYPTLDLNGFEFVEIPELGLILSKLELP